MPGPSQGLDPAAVDELASRLADDATLRVPASLSGQVQEEAPDRSKRVEYLTALLQRDPGVFLERHGEHLGTQDLQAFDGLRDDYEVHFFLRQLEQRREAPSQPRPGPQVRNRRLAHLNRLIDAGEYFSEDAMRQRQPLLHHQYVGQYQPAAEPSIPRPSEGRSHPLSNSILTDIDEAATKERFDRAQAAQDAIEEESSDEEMYPEDRRAEVDQNPPRPEAAPAAGSAEETFTRIATGEAQLQATRPAPPPAAGPAPRSATEPVAAAVEAAGGTGGGAAAGAERDQQGEQADAENRPDTAPYVQIPEEERRQLASDFLELMHQRFLAGDDEGFVDYKKVDADEALDDDWAAERQQDAEDAYFNLE